MGLVNAVYSWPSVKALYLTVLSMNLAGLLAIALAILWAVRFERGFGDYLNLVTPGDGHAWTAVLISAAVCCSPAYILGIKCWLCLRMVPARSDLEDQGKVYDGNVDPHYVNRLLFFHVLACLLSGFLVAILNATYLLLLSGFQQRTRDGLIEAIERYSSDVAVKARIDAVQTELECCGDNSYEDWFRVPWLKVSVDGPDDTEKGPRLEEQSATEERDEESSNPVDVPFSCCSNDIPKPCVHHDILKPSAIYDYDPKHLTITTRGCRSRIVSRGEVIRIFLAGYLGLLSVYQVVLSLMSRLLQTAHSNHSYIGPEKLRYSVWIFFQPEHIGERPATSRDTSEHRETASKGGSARSRPDSGTGGKMAATGSSGSDSSPKETFQWQKRRRNSLGAKIRSKMAAGRSKSSPSVTGRGFPSAPRIEYRGSRVAKCSERRAQGAPSSGARSELALRQDRRSLFSLLSSDSSSTDLPPPPPPPPVQVTPNLQSEAAGSKNLEELQRRSSIEAAIAGEPLAPPANAPLDRTRNSGRRMKVLERFGEIWERATRHRESGGADDSSSNGSSNSSSNGRGSMSGGSGRQQARRCPPELHSTDVYNRFRGTLQHTLARREASLAGRLSRNIFASGNPKDSVAGTSNWLARLRCTNVPPSYRLLATLNAPGRPRDRADSPRRSIGNKEQRQCSVCNRPVQQSPSGGSSPSLAGRKLPKR